MILRKPYAFLIKQFRIIHIILTFLAAYILNQTSDIYTFFSNYISNGYSAVIGDGFTSSFINFNLFLVLFLLVGMLITVSVLLIYKKKNDKMYMISIIYYVLLVIFFIFYYTVFNSMESGVITANSARVYNDVALIFYLPQYLLIMFFAVRGLGFNVKQFNFKRDLEEMDLVSEDNEEIELNIEFNGYKTKRNFRRFIREMKYYIRENLIFFIIISVILIFTFSYNIISNLAFFNNYYYDLGDRFYYDGFYVTFNEAYVTNTDEGGNVISEGKYFLVLNVTIENLSTQDKTIDINDYSLLYNGELINPSNEYSNLFSDYGSTLIYSNIKYSSSGEYVVVYEISEKDINDDFSLKLFTTTFTSGDVIYPIYTIVEIEQTVLKETIDQTSYSLASTLNLSNTNVGESYLTIKSYDIANVFYYEYEKCISDVCSMYTESLYIDYTSTSHNGKTILAIEGELLLDETTQYYLNNKSYYSFFTNLVKVRYRVDDVTYESDATAFTKDTGDGKYYLLVSSEIVDADNIDLIITIRNKEYIYELK